MATNIYLKRNNYSQSMLQIKKKNNKRKLKKNGKKKLKF